MALRDRFWGLCALGLGLFIVVSLVGLTVPKITPRPELTCSSFKVAQFSSATSLKKFFLGMAKGRRSLKGTYAAKVV